MTKTVRLLGLPRPAPLPQATQHVTTTMMGLQGPQTYFGKVIKALDNGQVLCRWWLEESREGHSWLEGAASKDLITE